eukprot:3985140-Alexandrium_andersonii.AAC.1
MTLSTKGKVNPAGRFRNFASVCAWRGRGQTRGSRTVARALHRSREFTHGRRGERPAAQVRHVGGLRLGD